MLKQVLLNTGYFVDNSYLDEYLELVQKPFSFSGYSEKHHVIPAVVYKVKHGIKDNRMARKLAAKDEGNFWWICYLRITAKPTGYYIIVLMEKLKLVMLGLIFG